MAKKITALLCMIIMVLGLSACGAKNSSPENSSDSTSKAKVSCKEVLEGILTEVTDTHNDTKLFYEDEKYEEYFEYLYDTSVKRVNDGAFAYASASYADEITVLYAAEEDDVDTIEKHLEDRIERRIQDFNGYKPEEVAKLENARIETEGRYIIMVVADDPDKVIETFETLIK